LPIHPDIRAEGAAYCVFDRHAQRGLFRGDAVKFAPDTRKSILYADKPIFQPDKPIAETVNRA
jgi:hypothetical protein